MREGTVEQIGRPEDVFRMPRTEYVANFLGVRNRFVVESDGSIPTVSGRQLRLDDRLRTSLATAKGALSLRCRPEDLTIERADNDSDLSGTSAPLQLDLGVGRIAELLPDGRVTEFIVDIGGEFVVAQKKGTATDGGLAIGDRVSLRLRVADALWYVDETLLTYGTADVGPMDSDLSAPGRRL